MDRWKSILTDVIDDATTVTNCVLLAMHMVYLAPLAPGLRLVRMDITPTGSHTL